MCQCVTDGAERAEIFKSGDVHGDIPELFVHKIPSYKILDVAVAPGADVELTGIRPGEELHEMMISEDDSRRTLEFDDYFIIQPDFGWWSKEGHLLKSGRESCEDGFSYKNDTNIDWLSIDDLKKILEEFIEHHSNDKSVV